jgi:2-amino-4-hydroxy-6-hydroxymethyldihydropteridine diphosphokinase
VEALAHLERVMTGIRRAAIYETEPVEGAGPQAFLNTVVTGWTTLSPAELLAALHEIEGELGRVREPGSAKRPRTIDIDLLLYAGRAENGPGPVIPHPRMHLRRFVLVPLLDLAPAAADPRDGRPYRSWLAAAPAQRIELFRARST